jgi:hypothetical protein
VASRASWLTPVILATQEAEIRRIKVLQKKEKKEETKEDLVSCESPDRGSLKP